MSLDGAISLTPWPIPQHSNCACFEEEIFPGDDAATFHDWRDKLKLFTDAQKEDALGQSLWKLIKNKVVDFDDVVLPDRIRSLAEVVRVKRLSFDDLVNAGVSRTVAGRAVKAAQEQTVEEIKRAHREELARRVGVAAGPAHALREAVAAGARGETLVAPGELAGPFAGPAAPPAPPDLPAGDAADAERAELIREFMRRWPDLPLDLLAFLVVEEETRKRKQEQEAREKAKVP
jgi:hypothetical protein